MAAEHSDKAVAPDASPSDAAAAAGAGSGGGGGSASSDVAAVSPPAAGANGDAATTAAEGGPAMSKKAIKRQRRHEQRKEKWARQKQAAKRLKKETAAKRAAEVGVPLDDDAAPGGGGDASTSAPSAASLRRKARKDAWEAAAKSGQRVIIDCSFEDKMTPRENRSMVQQILYCYGVTRRMFDSPFHMYVTSYGGAIKAGMESNPGYTAWSVSGVVLCTHWVLLLCHRLSRVADHAWPLA